ncbi:hypothetical protein X801_08089 [Opisthorchis viverrini]|nr:hypothetical protein X801_08089 [Opisthorchis viverrini]
MWEPSIAWRIGETRHALGSLNISHIEAVAETLRIGLDGTDRARLTLPLCASKLLVAMLVMLVINGSSPGQRDAEITAMAQPRVS